MVAPDGTWASWLAAPCQPRGAHDPRCFQSHLHSYSSGPGPGEQRASPYPASLVPGLRSLTPGHLSRCRDPVPARGAKWAVDSGEELDARGNVGLWAAGRRRRLRVGGGDQ
jgi:hypothetical protein